MTPTTARAVTRRPDRTLVWALVALAGLLVYNTVKNPNFLSIRLLNGHLYGSPIDILRNAAPIMLLALGMTLVIATRGIDLSVSSVAVIAGAVAVTHIADSADPTSTSTVVVGVLLGLAVAAVLGAWNGFFVSVVGVQPIVATLVLLIGGRGVAQLITDGQITTISSPPFETLTGYWFVPTALVIALAMYVIVGLITRRTALGMMIESVGINPKASHLAGVRTRTIVWTVYIVSGITAGIGGLLIASDISAADSVKGALWWELDAILAVVIGGTSLAGGRFSLAGTLVGAVFIQTLTTTVYAAGISPEQALAFKGSVVLIVTVLQSRRTSEFLLGLRGGRRARRDVVATENATEAPAMAAGTTQGVAQ